VRCIQTVVESFEWHGIEVHQRLMIVLGAQRGIKEPDAHQRIVGGIGQHGIKEPSVHKSIDDGV
jgi:hypothetical protein